MEGSAPHRHLLPTQIGVTCLLGLLRESDIIPCGLSGTSGPSGPLVFVSLTHGSSQECDYCLDLWRADSMVELPARDVEFVRGKNYSPQQSRGAQQMTYQDLTLPKISTAQTTQPGVVGFGYRS